jgi:enterochelin esterase-like enzyme
MKTVLFHLIGILLGLNLFLMGCTPLAPVVPLPIPPSTLAPTSQPSPSPLPTAPEATPTPGLCRETHGSLEHRVLEAARLEKPFRYIVYRPPCYWADPTQRYPVLYLLHGQGYDEAQWLRLGAVTTLDRLIISGEAPPFIIVMPFDYSFKQPSEYRFEEVFTQLLVPQIDMTYRTLTDKAHRAVGGLSRGGAWAIRLGTRHPELFGAMGGHSPSVFYADMDALPQRLLTIPAEQMPRIWLDAGDADSEYATVQIFEQLLNRQNIPHEWHTYIGWHDETYWSAHVEEYLRWYAQEWK